jgi:hypothetical protein
MFNPRQICFCYRQYRRRGRRRLKHTFERERGEEILDGVLVSARSLGKQRNIYDIFTNNKCSSGVRLVRRGYRIRLDGDSRMNFGAEGNC